MSTPIHPFIKDLNPGQQEAVLYNEGPMLILAGAGSGKTKTLTTKLAYLVKEFNYHPADILAITFTNKAAKEMKERAEKTLNQNYGFNIYTFHSFCARILRSNSESVGLKKDFTIYDDSESLAIIKNLNKLKGNDGDDDFSPSSISSYIDHLKNIGYYSNHPTIKLEEHGFNEYFDLYEKELLNSNAVDFGGLQTMVLKLFHENPTILKHYQKLFRFIMVDEYQDTNLAQFELINLLAAEHKQLCCVGDLDQGIYSFRDATIQNILDFEKTYPGYKLIKLEHNYRSTSHILDAANAVIKHNVHRKDKTLHSTKEEGSKIKIIQSYDEKVEAKYIVSQIDLLLKQKNDPKQISVFFRNNALSRTIEEQLRTYRIPYIITGGMKFFDRKEIKDMLAYLRLVQNPSDAYAMLRVINVPGRGIGSTSLDKICQVAYEKAESHWEVVNNMKKFNLKLSTKSDTALIKFCQMIKNGQDMVSNESSILHVYDWILKESGYLTMLEKSTDYQDQARVDNLKELRSSILEYDQRGETLSEFLNNVALISDEANEKVNKDQCINLMTIHSAKGLEFDNVFIMGVEENLFPSKRSLADKNPYNGIEEERRLFYVAVTRARKELTITYTNTRFMYGKTDHPRRSRFIEELPPENIKEIRI